MVSLKCPSLSLENVESTECFANTIWQWWWQYDNDDNDENDNGDDDSQVGC